MINIVLFEPEIPQNTGNIMRTCVGTKTKLHLIKPFSFSLDEKSIKRCGVNYIDKCDYQIYENLEEFFKDNQGEYFYITRYGQKAYSEIDYQSISNIYLIFGKESTGLPKSLLKNNFDYCLRIPTTDQVRSLNLSNCVSLVLYEVLRQKKFPNLCNFEPHKGKDFLLED